MKKKIVSIALVVAMLAIAVAGGTIAYLTDTDSNVNVMTVGNVNIEQIEVFDEENATMYPGDGYTEKRVSIENVGKSDAYIRTLIAFEDTWDATVDVHYCIDDGVTELNFPSNDKDNFLQIKATNKTTGEWTVYTVGYYDYDGMILSAGETSPLALKDVGLDADAGNDWYAKVGETYEVLALSQAVQISGFDTAEDAFATTFGEITMDSDALVAEWFQEVLGDEYTVEAFDYTSYDWSQEPKFDATAID